jgi:hypothetical protein
MKYKFVSAVNGECNNAKNVLQIGVHFALLLNKTLDFSYMIAYFLSQRSVKVIRCDPEPG